MPQLFYSETAPNARLAALVDCQWTVAVDPSGPGAPQHWVLPDGYWTLSIGLKPTWYVRLRRPSASPFIAPCIPGDLIVGVRFRPGPPPLEILSQTHEKLTKGQSVPEIWGNLNEILSKTVTGRDARLDYFVSSLRKSNGSLSIAQMADQISISDRHLERLSKQQLGLSPKTFARIVRLQSALRLLIANPDKGLADAAVDLGYTDQTHMTRDVTNLGLITPRAYQRSIQNVGFVLDAGSNSG